MFNEGRTNVHDEERSGHPSLITEDLKKQIDEQIRRDRRLTLDELHEKFPQISRSLLHEILSKHLGYKKICTKLVPYDHRKNAWALHCSFLSIITETETSFSTILSQGMKLWFPTSPLTASVSR
jgi:hypothetical protein